jgi:hypothetical protein
MFNLCNSDHLKAGLFIEKVPSLNTISDLPGTPEIEPGKELTLLSTIRERSDDASAGLAPGEGCLTTGFMFAPQNHVRTQDAESMHYVHNGLVFLWRAAVVKGELVQAVGYCGLRRANPFWHFGPVRFQHSRGVKRIPAVAHLRNDVTSAIGILFNFAHIQEKSPYNGACCASWYG